MNPELERKGWIDEKVKEFIECETNCSAAQMYDFDIKGAWFRTALTEAYELGRKDKLEEMRPLLEDTVKFLQRKS
jgi:hypothetical protein